MTDMLNSAHHDRPKPLTRQLAFISEPATLPLDLLVDVMPSALLLADVNGYCIEANRAALRLLARTRDEVVGKDIRTFVPDAAGLSAQDASASAVSAVDLGEATVRRGPAGERRIALSLVIIKGHTQPILAYFLRDITDEVALVAQLRTAARTDPLTGLPNRLALEETLDRTLRNISRGAPAAALCFLDLDNFKAVNDAFGHVAGDRVLRQVASVLRRRLRLTDTAGRLGGDEFALVLQGCHIDHAQEYIHELRRKIAGLDMNLPGCRRALDLSAGITVLTERTASATTALAEADQACYAAKAAGRAKTQIFTECRPESDRKGTGLLLV